MVFVANGFGQATLVFDSAGPSGPTMTTFGFLSSTPLDPDAEATRVRTAWATAGGLFTRIESTSDLAETRVIVRGNDGELRSGLDSTAVPSTNSSNAASPQVAMLIQKRTGLAGRNRRGRMFIPGAINPGQDGLFTAAEFAAHQTAADVFFNALIANDVPMWLLHVSEADPPNEVTALVVQQLTATQRRRIR
jgi:hypothetical protein